MAFFVIVCKLFHALLSPYSKEGSAGFARLSKGSMAQRRLGTPDSHTRNLIKYCYVYFRTSFGQLEFFKEALSYEEER